MSPRALRALAWLCVVLATVATAALIVTVGLGSDSPSGIVLHESWMVPIAYAATALAWVSVGAAVVVRRPANRVGWVLVAIGVSLPVGQALIAYADLALYVVEWLPGGVAAAVAGNGLLAAGMNIPLVLLLFLFPTGRPLTPAWGRVVVVAVAVLLLGVLGEVSRPGPVGEFTAIANPLALGGRAAAMAVVAADASFLALPLIATLAIWQLVSRHRRSSGVEKVQLRWFAYAASVLGLSTAVSFTLAAVGLQALADATFIGIMVALLLVPIAVGVAILRYRLYEIDRLINRTIVYAAVTATLVAIYAGGVFGLGAVVRSLGGAVVGDVSDHAFGDLLVAASTLAAAAAFVPVRARIQRIVDHRFDRGRYDAVLTVEDFGARLREEVDLDVLATDLREVVVKTVRPEIAGLWLAHVVVAHEDRGTGQISRRSVAQRVIS